MEKKSNGQRLVDALEAWIGGYLFLADRDVPLVLALWAIGSWCFDRFYTWPYLAVTASVKGAGKSRVLELLAPLTRNSLMTAAPTPAFVLREARNLGGHFTLLWDEAEAASSDQKSFLSEVLNSGYRKGQVIGRAKGPDETVKYPSYFPKAFALIGDTTGTVRDRSIVLTMIRGNAAREYYPEVAAGEGAALAGQIQATLADGDSSIASAPPMWLDARDREIWGAMFGLVEWLQLDRKTVERLERWAADNVASKTAPARRNTSYESEDDATVGAYGERALRDLAGVLAPGEGAIWSRVAVERMRALPTGPWRTFKGTGLSEALLANLVSRFGVQPKYVRMVKGKGAKAAPTSRGYTAADILASLPGKA